MLLYFEKVGLALGVERTLPCNRKQSRERTEELRAFRSSKVVDKQSG